MLRGKKECKKNDIYHEMVLIGVDVAWGLVRLPVYIVRDVVR